MALRLALELVIGWAQVKVPEWVVQKELELGKQRVLQKVLHWEKQTVLHWEMGKALK